MEIEKNLHNYIKIYEKVMPKNQLEVLKKICKNEKKFEEGKIIKTDGTHEVEKNIRKTNFKSLFNIGNESLTDVHWANYLNFIFGNGITDYYNFLNLSRDFRVLDIQILKYTKGSHYKFHIDHAATSPRTLSCIFLINDDYEGGDLVFRYPITNKEVKIPKKENTLIIWPSNFLYPHSVMPVESGERYSVVSWTL